MGLTSEAIWAYLETVEALPALSEHGAMVLDALNQPDCSMEDVIEEVRHDPALSARILRMANTSMQGARVEITSVVQAAARLGQRAVLQCATAHYVMSAFPPPQVAYDMQAFWRRSVAVAYITESLAQLVQNKNVIDIPTAGECFTAGLLNDLGVLVLLQGFPEDTAEAIRIARATGKPLRAYQQANWGVHHGEVGAALCEKWGMPKAIAAAALYRSAPGQAQPEFLGLAEMVHVAHFLCINRGLFDDGEVVNAQIDEAIWQHLGLQLGDIEPALEQAEAAAGRATVVC